MTPAISAAAEPAGRRAAHFGSLAQQAHAARMGMWIFLATEVLIFGGLFVGYFTYRSLFPHAFHATSHHLDLFLGTIETGVLLTSSLTAALAVVAVRARARRATVALLVVTLACGLIFLGLHGVEYAHEFHEGMLPGRFFRFVPLARELEGQLDGAQMFLSLYFLMTGLHGLHVTIGVGVLGVMAFRAARGAFDDGYEVPIEIAALYWHLVDVIWIFLYPLLYLVS